MRYCLALDLVNDPQLMAEYEAHHQKVWPEVVASIKESGISAMEIYRVENRLFMIMETTENFSFDAKSATDSHHPKVQEWESLMWKYQQAIPGGQAGEKWRLMGKIFGL
jgi:L-rhamnose mutarotase